LAVGRVWYYVSSERALEGACSGGETLACTAGNIDDAERIYFNRVGTIIIRAPNERSPDQSARGRNLGDEDVVNAVEGRIEAAGSDREV
jgi:hypothetical protein